MSTQITIGNTSSAGEAEVIDTYHSGRAAVIATTLKPGESQVFAVGKDNTLKISEKVAPASAGPAERPFGADRPFGMGAFPPDDVAWQVGKNVATIDLVRRLETATGWDFHNLMPFIIGELKAGRLTVVVERPRSGDSPIG